MRQPQIFIFLLLAAFCVFALNVDPTAHKIYFLSDVHYDPFYGTKDGAGDCTSSNDPKYGRAKCDSPLLLVDSAVQDVLLQLSLDADGTPLLLGGDTVRHDLDMFENQTAPNSTERYAPEFVISKKIYDTVFATIRSEQSKHSTLKHMTIMTTQGNNDCIPKYYFDDNSATHPSFQLKAEEFESNGFMTAAEVAEYSKYGRYLRDVPGTPVTIMSINTIIYSSGHADKPPESDKIDDPCGQFTWMGEQLTKLRAAKRVVYIFTHMAPMVGLWVEKYNSNYTHLMEEFVDVVKMQFFGHMHNAQFFLLTSDKPTPPAIVAPSITRRDNTIPAYVRLFLKPTTWEIDTVEQRYLDVDADLWKTGAYFPQDFGFNNITQKTLIEYGHKLLEASDKSDLWKQFLTFYEGGVLIEEMSSQRKTEIICQMLHRKKGDYTKCVEKK